MARPATFATEMAKTLRDLLEDRGMRSDDLRMALPAKGRPVLSAVNFWLAGTTRPRGHRLAGIATALGVTVDELREVLDETRRRRG